MSKEMISLCKKVLGELSKICGEVIDSLDKHLIPKDQTTESEVFYLQMKGDQLRYMAELICDDIRQNCSSKSDEANQAGTDLSKELKKVHPYRVGIALNYIQDNPTNCIGFVG